mmetsp:Transcript_25898/g.41583  ORF Transcript_25898/g.41583 Transcript_25898/m.41583 type:complete len:221 (-) Transcript_25898:2098-2760(-)
MPCNTQSSMQLLQAWRASLRLRGGSETTIPVVDDILMPVRHECVAISLEELSVELDPMQPQDMQYTFQHVHTHQHGEGNRKPNREHDERHDHIDRESASHSAQNGFLKEHEGQLLMRQRQCPQTQVRRCVGNCSEHVLDCLDDLMDHDLTEIRMLVFHRLGLVTVYVEIVKSMAMSTIAVLLRMPFHTHVQDNRLRDEQPWNCQHRYRHQKSRHFHAKHC